MSISPASLWLILALVLAGMEMLTTTFYMLALAIGFSCGSLFAVFGAPFPAQVSTAALASIVAAILLRRWKKKHMQPEKESFLDVGLRVTVSDWRGQKHLQVQHRGCQWSAELAPGAETGHTHYYIVSIHGSILIVHHLPPSEQN